ncbi:hypothetical protein CJD36_008855 [Flavipsychrobacter stenotrophus]|uniref:Thioredoxin domain-containing protein n=1 Tax=Flavipsychrobacter stenotrophus TaxID=2077091 RepID=A0A2S7SYV0_9BACT|nr:hypothetical protein [Flavipsychrobacter stenotrophus]PQJ11894.1 hypothetical protein CJD36_008855 [Flavipsychrobacter stenotrophus]
MKQVKFLFATLLLVISARSYSQMPVHTPKPKLIAVVNSATWCGVCKANAARFTAVLMPYSNKGVNIYLNDLSNEQTKEASKQQLQKDNVYEAVITTPRKGMGKALKACRMIQDKKHSADVSGIVTFIDPVTHKQLKQVSIAATDAEMTNTINKLLN